MKIPMHRLGLIVSIATLLTVCLSSAGWADWKNTKWGMSVDEVLAVNPTLTPLDKSTQEQSRAFVSDGRSVAMLAAHYLEGPYQYLALFYFDLSSKRLVSVNLSLRNMHLADQLLDDLLKTYGTPVDSKEIAPSFYSRIWEADGNRIVFLRTPDTAKVNFFVKR
jgi:hypothetical protein